MTDWETDSINRRMRRVLGTRPGPERRNCRLIEGRKIREVWAPGARKPDLFEVWLVPEENEDEVKYPLKEQP